MSLLTRHHPGGTAHPQGSPLAGTLAFCHRAGVLLCQAVRGQIQVSPWHCGTPNNASTERGRGSTSSSASHCVLPLAVLPAL